MSDRDNPRSLVEIMNDVLSTVREHYDSEYVYYIEKEYEDIDVIYEWCAKHVPWQRDKIKMLPKDQRPRWMEQEITDTTEDIRDSQTETDQSDYSRYFQTVLFLIQRI